MSVRFLLVAPFCITSVLALPNHNPVARKRQAVSDSSPLPTFTSDLFEDSYASASRAYASATKAEAEAESNFFRTAEPTAKAAYSSDLAAQSSWEADVEEHLTYTGTSDIVGYGSTPTNQSAIWASRTKAEALEQSQFFRTAVPTAKAALSSDLAAQSSWQADIEEYLTYTGTSDILGFGPTPTNRSTNDYLDFQPIPTDQSAVYASVTKAQALELSEFFRTAEPTAKAALSSEVAAQRSLEADILEAATYTGTSDLFGFGPIETATSLSPSEASLLSNYYELQTAIANADATATAQTDLSTSTGTPRWPEPVSSDSEPVSYGVECRVFNSPGSVRTVNRCKATIAKICSYIDNANRGVAGGAVDAWMYAIDNGDDSQNNTCGARAYLPRAAVGTKNVPSVEQCVSLVYGRMIDICSGGLSFDNARVNVQGGSANYTDPRDETQLGGSSSGRLIDPDLPGYSVNF